jgi:hypothetical protein
MRQPPENSATARPWSALSKPSPCSSLAARARAGVAVDRVQALVRVRDAVTVVLGLRAREFGLDPAQLDVAVQGVLERGLRAGRRFLRHGRDAELPRHAHVALVRGQLAQDHGEQAGLAGAVPPHDAHAPARVHRRVHVAQQGARAAAQGQVGETQHGERGLMPGRASYGAGVIIQRLECPWNIPGPEPRIAMSCQESRSRKTPHRDREEAQDAVRHAARLRRRRPDPRGP